MEADPSNPEAQQAWASFCLVTGNLEEARTAMDASLQLWLPQHLLFLGDSKFTSNNSKVIIFFFWDQYRFET